MKTEKNKKFLFIFPPEWYFGGPNMALPSLSAQLKKEGYNSAVLDLNIKFFNDILKEDYLKKSLTKIEELYKELPLRKDFETNLALKNKYLQIKNFIEGKQYTLINKIMENVNKSISIMKTPSEFKNIKQAYFAMNVINMAKELVFLKHIKLKASFDYADLKSQVLDTENNLYFEYFSEILPDIKAKKADFIGISINSASQLIAGLTLAYLLKKNTTAHINIGGSFFSQSAESLKKYPEIYELFVDSISIWDGENSIIEMAKFINGEIEITEVPSISYAKDKIVFINEKQTNIYLREISIPDYSDINFQDYISPFPILSISMSKGCYWNKCAFCGLGNNKNYSEKPIPKLIDELKFYKEKYGVSYFSIVDPCVTPKYLNKLSDEIIKNKMDIYFEIWLRFEKQFDKKLLGKMYKAGFLRLFWGLESINQKTLNDINKGIDAKNVKTILTNSDKVKIWNIVYFIIGFPTEKPEDTIKTIDFIFENRKIIDEYCCTPFALAKNSICLKNHDEYEIVISNVQKDFSGSVDFSYKNQSTDMVEKLSKIVEEKNRKQCVNSQAYCTLGLYMLFYLKLYEKSYLVKNKIL